MDSLKGQYYKLIEYYEKELKKYDNMIGIQCNHKVTEIKDSMSNIITNQSKINNNYRIILTVLNETSNQTKMKQIHCKYVIVTIPLFMLQKQTIHFIPRLPTWKQNASESQKIFVCAISVFFLVCFVLCTKTKHKYHAKKS